MSTADWDGAGYERISALQRWLAERTLAGIGFRGDERLLDVGCGDGFITRALAARLPRGEVLGVDASPRMIAVARGRAAPRCRPARRCGSSGATPSTSPASGEFDVVVSFNTLHWLHDQRAALAAIAGVTVPGGRVIVQQVCAGPRPSLESVAMQVCATPAVGAVLRRIRGAVRARRPRRLPGHRGGGGAGRADARRAGPHLGLRVAGRLRAVVHGRIHRLDRPTAARTRSTSGWRTRSPPTNRSPGRPAGSASCSCAPS